MSPGPVDVDRVDFDRLARRARNLRSRVVRRVMWHAIGRLRRFAWPSLPGTSVIRPIHNRERASA
jgi:hypothetical protein